MKKCKNIECNNEVNKNRTYCSLKCRNIYVNKYLRDYNKNSEGLKKKSKELEEEYNKSPKKCKYCNEIIPFDKKTNSYCNSSCMASHTNKFKIGLKRNFSEEGLKNIQEANRKRRELPDYYDNPNRCTNCEKGLEYKRRDCNFCDNQCKKEYFSKNREDYKIYHSLTKFKFNLADYKDEFDFELLEKYGIYKASNNGDNLNGVSRDHKFSVKEGFRRLINPLLLSHPVNCELLKHNDNISKLDKCSITIEELLDEINKFDNKYGRYYNDELKIFISTDEMKELSTT